MRFGQLAFVWAVWAAWVITGCNAHYTIDGKVVDATTRQPVAGAVVSVNWTRIKLQIPIGFAPERAEYGTSEHITDARGKFSIPNYPFASHYMGVYKEGYICWSSEKIYTPNGTTHDEKYVDRKRHRIKNWMIVELTTITKEEFPAWEHARFVSVVSTQVCGRKFSDSTIKERRLDNREYRKKIGKE